MRQKWLKVISMILICLCLTGTFYGCGKEEGEGESVSTGETAEETEGEKELRIALVGPMTGDNAQYGLQFQRGVKEAVDKYNAIGGPQVIVEVFDDKNDAKEAVSIGNKIIADGNYMAVIGPFSSTCALAMAEVLDEEKIISMSPSVSHSDYVALYDYTFRLCNTNAYEGEVAARYMKEEEKVQKAAVIYSNNDWGIGVDNAFLEEAKAIGLEVAANESFILGQTKDFSSALTKIKQSGAEAIFFAGQYTEAAMVMKQAADMQLELPLLISSSSYKQEALELAGKTAEGAVFLTSFFEDPENEKLMEFSEMIKEKYDTALDNFILRAYDAAEWILKGYDKCQSEDPEQLRQAIKEIGMDGYEGMGGLFTLTEERNVERVFLHTRWNGKNGEDCGFELVK